MTKKQIVVVEDNSDHAELLLIALKRLDTACEVTVFGSGEAALDFLRARDPEEETPRLILLDIKLPGCTGLETLEELKSSPRTAGIPVVVLTTSDSPEDIEIAEKLGADMFLTKQVGHQDFNEKIAVLMKYL